MVLGGASSMGFALMDDGYPFRWIFEQTDTGVKGYARISDAPADGASTSDTGADAAASDTLA